MNGRNGDSWRRLVCEALSDPDRISAIFEALDPILRKLARRVAWSLADDAVQAARIAIWRALPKVDPSRSRSIRSMLLKAAYYAMRDEVRRELRQARLPLEHLRSMPVCALDARSYDFGGILDMYARYVRRAGSFAGAHRHVARTLGVSIAKTTSDFHRAARQYIEREGLRPRRKQYADILQMILEPAGQGEAEGPGKGGF